jgi:hypothetical protein
MSRYRADTILLDGLKNLCIYNCNQSSKPFNPYQPPQKFRETELKRLDFFLRAILFSRLSILPEGDFRFTGYLTIL